MDSAWRLAALALVLAGCIGDGQTAGPLAPPMLRAQCPDGVVPDVDERSGRILSGCNVSVARGRGPVNEPSIAINPTDPNNLVAGANDYNAARPWCGVYVSTDGGTTWDNGFLPGHPNDRSVPPSPLFGFDGCGDAALAFGPDGTVYYAGIAFRRGAPAVSVPTPSGTPAGAGVSYGEGASLFVARSRDGGASWDVPLPPQRGVGYAFGVSTPVQGAGAYTQESFNDKEFIAVSQTTGRVVMTWTDFRFLGVPADTGEAPVSTFMFEAPIKMVVSNDDAQTWSEPVLLSRPETGNQGSVPAFAPDGTLAVAWGEGVVDEGPDRADLPDLNIVVRVSRDGGDTFLEPINVATTKEVSPTHNTRDNSFPSIAYHPATAPHPGRLSIAWAGNLTGDADIYYSQSDDHGRTWAEPVRVNQDPIRNGRDQVFPWVAVTPDGGVHIVYFDGREDPRNDYLAVYVASTRDGATFRETRVTDAPFLADRDGFRGDNFLGDYLAIAASERGVYPLWPDTRIATDGLGDTDLYTQRLIVTG